MNSLETNDSVTDLKNLPEISDINDFSKLDNHISLYGESNKKFVGELKIETPKLHDTDEFVSLRPRTYAAKHEIEEDNKKRITQ